MSERDMRKLLALIAQRVGLTYEDVAKWLHEQNSIESIERRILQGNYNNAIVNVDDAAKQIAAEIQEGYITAGQRAAEYLDTRVPDRLIRFDTTSPQIVHRAEQNQLELVRGFRDERNQIAKQITQRALEDGARLGTNPRRVAQDFRDSIALTPGQQQWVANYRRSLESGDYQRALGYELSDGNADRSVRSAQAREAQLSPQQIDKMVERYRQNAITYRSETIARTEALRNANAGVRDGIQQAIDRGDVKADELVVTWHAGPGTKDARESHQRLDGTTVKYGEDFMLPDGTRMSGPGDPRGGAGNVTSCRCTSSVTLA